LSVVEHRVGDIDGSVRLFGHALGGEVVSRQDTADGSVAELTWENGARMRLVQAAADRLGNPRLAEGIGHLQFSRDGGAFSPEDLEKAAVLSRRLGVSVRLGVVAEF
jgi:hypothetical protein